MNRGARLRKEEKLALRERIAEAIKKDPDRTYTSFVEQFNVSRKVVYSVCKELGVKLKAFDGCWGRI